MKISYAFQCDKLAEIRIKLTEAIKANEILLKREFDLFNNNTSKKLIDYVDFLEVEKGYCEPRYNQLNEYLRERVNEIYILILQSYQKS